MSRDDKEIENHLSYPNISNEEIIQTPFENKLGDQYFDLRDPFSVEWSGSNESAVPIDQKYNRSNQFFESCNFSLLNLQNPLLTDDEIKNLNTIIDQDSILNDHFNHVPLDEIEPLNEISGTQPQINDEKNKLQVVNPRIIKYDQSQQIEEEINSSPQILQRNSADNSNNAINFNQYKFIYSPLFTRILQQKSDNKIFPQRERKNFTKDQKKVMLDFIQEHKDNPYIDNANILKISKETGLSNKQIRIFLTNYRVRNSCSQKRRNRKPLGEALLIRNKKFIFESNSISKFKENSLNLSNANEKAIETEK